MSGGRLSGRLRKIVVGMVAVGTLAGVSTALTGCGNFFVCAKASCTDSGSSTTANYAYVSNSTSGSTYINGYELADAKLTATTSSPYLLNYTPSSMVVTTNNGTLYVGSNTGLTSGVAAVHGYTIGTGGALTSLSSGNALVQAQVAALDVSPDGKWLFALNINDGVNLTTITEFAIGSAGGLTIAQTVNYSGATNGIVTPLSIKVSPNGNYIAAALGTGGVATFPFNTTTGVIGTETLISFTASAVGANDIGIDKNNFLYMATTTGVLAFSVSAAGLPSSSSVSSLTTGTSALTSLAVDGTSFVYAGNASSNTLYGYSTTSAGVLTALSPASITGPTSLGRLARESSGTYLLGLGFATSGGLQLYSIGTGGALTSVANAGTGATTGVPTVMALTH